MDDPQHDIPMHPTDAPGLTPGASSRPAPPTEAGVIADRPPAWPSTIGILAVVFSSLTLVSSIGGAIMMVLATAAAPLLGGPPIGSLSTIGWILTVAAYPLAVWHLIAGILLIKRSIHGPRQLIAWAIINSLFVVLSTGLSVTGALTTAPTPGGPPMLMQSVSAVLGLIMQLIWPFLVILLLTRPKRMAHWKSWR